MRNKKDFFADFGIEYKNNHIMAPWGEMVPLPLTWGSKTHCFGWSTLAGTKDWTVTFNGSVHTMRGTCSVQCPGCYGCSGRYCMPSVKDPNAWRTVAARVYMGWLKNAIVAQILWGRRGKALECVRIHITGDFFSADYIQMWRDIIAACVNTEFWAYTKNPVAEHAFDDLPNMNVVKSIVPEYGFNFGRCGRVIDMYNALRAAGIPTHVCRCAVDGNQHCDICGACRKLDYVLFVEHGTEYKMEKDPRYAELLSIVNSAENIAAM